MSLENLDKLPADVQQAILEGPAMEPPNGTVSNFDNPPNGNGWGLFIVILCVFLTTVTGLMRAYTRFVLKRGGHVEDYLSLLGYGAFLGCAGCLFAIYHLSGLFVHQWNIRLGTYLDIAEILIVFTICYCLTMTFIKPAILLEWVRIFVPDRKHNAFFWTAWVLIVINAALYASSTIATIFTCTPPEKSWKPWVAGTCSDRRALDVGMGFFNLAMDVFILALPQRVIWRLQMTRARRIGITAVFSVGVLACACAVLRLYYNWIAEYSGQGDTTYTISALFLSAFGELSCVLLVFFVPSVPKAFIESGFYKFASTLYGRKTNTKSSESGKGHAFPRTIGSALTRPRLYRVMDDYGSHTMSLSELERSTERGADIDVEVAITQTSEVALKTCTQPETMERQHPWMGS